MIDNGTNPSHAQPLTEEENTLIRERALQLWEAEGRPENRADEYWHRARELIEDEGKSAYPPAQSQGHRT